MTESTTYMYAMWTIIFITYNTQFIAKLSAKDSLLAEMQAKLTVNESKFQELQAMKNTLNN